MKILKSFITWAILVAMLLTAVVTISLIREPIYSLEIKEFYLEAYKAVMVGFLIAALGVLVPQVLHAARDDFERKKDSRAAYSEAKTSIMYLREKLSEMKYSRAVKAVENAHYKLHIAETYGEMEDHLKNWHTNPKTWIDRCYWDLTSVRKLLHRCVAEWNTLLPAQRFELLTSVLGVVEKIFGRFDENNGWVELCEGIKGENEIEKMWNCRKKRVIVMENALDSWFKNTQVPPLPNLGRRMIQS